MVLLDTHALIWWMTDDDRLGGDARAMIADPESRVFVSGATAWEIATKFRIGKLPSMGAVVRGLELSVLRAGFETLPVSFAHAQRAGLLAGQHGDPFDRMLIAQGLTENLPIASNEAMFEHFGVSRIW